VSLPVVRSVEIGAPAVDVFDAFTRVSELLSWWCDGALVGLRPGGNWAIGFTNPLGLTEATLLGKIADFERGRKLVIEDISYEPAAGESLAGLSLVVTIEESEAGCRVTVEQDVPDAGPEYEHYRGFAGDGWEESLTELKKYLEGPRQRRVVLEAGLPQN
jgi:uncharacterized protein YndB with AHSA1/START domain